MLLLHKSNVFRFMHFVICFMSSWLSLLFRILIFLTWLNYYLSCCTVCTCNYVLNIYFSIILYFCRYCFKSNPSKSNSSVHCLIMCLISLVMSNPALYYLLLPDFICIPIILISVGLIIWTMGLPLIPEDVLIS
jgi:hypothetical protein